MNNWLFSPKINDKNKKKDLDRVRIEIIKPDDSEY